MFAGRALVRVARYTDLHHAAEWIETKGLHAFQSLERTDMPTFQKDICELQRAWREVDLWKDLYEKDMRAAVRGERRQFF